MRTYRIHRDAAQINVRRPVTTLIIRDGTMYFIMVLVLNIIHLVVFRTEGQIFLVSFICSLSAILASRFMLNFRQLGCVGVFTELSQCDAEDAAFSTTNPRDRCGHLETPIALEHLSRPRIIVQKDISIHTKEV
ncbi:hypothetical protein PHLGIDRAFT_230935 [Phlebiopsis gigantea 11061_1 CR5-6]|uniref:Uncharacterized protein n=1 Tax=Phlebiopsis gigantea (strain 11061_1 CR5-6) TaxID=745531 RepID=A0A0C3SBZ7_PHLG1|nr:hypothetical protein PHLGIDRAFT_230935 [Phlebiopsis gigantea 11061_1 CR5-6]